MANRFKILMLIFIAFLLIGCDLINGEDENLAGNRIYSSPAVTNEMISFGSSDGNFYAVDSQSGQQRWKFETGDLIKSYPFIRRLI